MTTTSFIFGVEGLDNHYPGVLAPGTLLIIAGYPGSGKTTMAAQLCYHNALHGRKCLYASLQETEEKFLKFMKRFDFDFEYLITSGVFKFSSLPLISSEEALDGVLESITNMVLEFNPKILIIDSITPITRVILGDAKRRALIQNYFYNLAFEMGGLVVLIVEIPLGERVIKETGDIEFVADGIIILEYEMVGGILSRKVEIRKLRGSPVDVSELPFLILPDKGILVVGPPRVKYPEKGVAVTRRYPITCKSLAEILGELYGGETILVAGPPHYVDPSNMLDLASRIAFESKTNMMIVSYRRDEYDIRRLLENIRKKSPELGELIDRTTVLHLDPTTLAVEALFGLELYELEKARPGVVVFLDADMLKHFYKVNPLIVDRHLKMEKLILRALESIAFRVARVINLDDISWELALADAILLIGDPVTGIAGGKLVAHKVGEESRILGSRDLLRECL